MEYYIKLHEKLLKRITFCAFGLYLDNIMYKKCLLLYIHNGTTTVGALTRGSGDMWPRENFKK